jgi:hypothetical protein
MKFSCPNPAICDPRGVWPRRNKASLPRPASVWLVFDSDFLHRLFYGLPISQRAQYEGLFVMSDVVSNDVFIVLCDWRSLKALDANFPAGA